MNTKTLTGPYRPQRRLFASAHTVLRLPLDAVRGDPRRSYLNFGDARRVWARGREELGAQLQELWRRMVFNALVGNTDDHPLNHGLLHDGGTQRSWHLAPAFDITPVEPTRFRTAARSAAACFPI
ncbi:HipA domain-containing protein [Cupriavidus pauculus]|uniref:HipA domain-containing protein n=1 Tax=Cupriavidus pauculus TaxID=82633 RepID=UPI00283A91E9|nr:HipA domain-containing protein [Cupriavidus pauculus]